MGFEIKQLPADVAHLLAPKITTSAMPTPTGCLLRTVQLGKTGYSRVLTPGSASERESFYAHRVVYAYYVGEIPDGMTIDHLCRVRNCVNVGHMEVVTPGENTLRGDSASGIRARMTHCAKGHEFSLEGGGRRRCKTCRRAYDAARYRPTRGGGRDPLV